MDNPIRMRVKESVMEIFTDILSDEDSIGLVIFNNEVKELLPLSSKKDLRLPMMSALMKGITCEGQTALWDGLYATWILNICFLSRQKERFAFG